jgi:putative ABC transport system permease protein
MALGASPHSIHGLVLREGLLPVVIGWMVGLIVAAWTMRSLRTLLFGVAPTDLRVFATATMVLFLGGLAGCIVPALRAARIDPVGALRHQ